MTDISTNVKQKIESDGSLQRNLERNQARTARVFKSSSIHGLHRDWLRGFGVLVVLAPFPRVTEILQPFTKFEFVPKDKLASAAARGTSVHALCAGIAKGAWVPDSMVDEELRGYVESFQKWADKQVSKFIVIEKRFQDEHLNYTGQVDFVVVGTDEEVYLVDIKTSATQHKTYPIQMAAYESLLRKSGIEVKGAMLVYLSKDGEFPEIDLIEDFTEKFHVFLSALDCYNYFNRKKKHARKQDAA